MTADSALLVFHANVGRYYQARWIERFVASIREQTTQDFDVLELDYGEEPDGWLFPDAAHRWHWPMTNHADAENFLLDQAFIALGYRHAFLTNVDDFYAPERIEAQLAYLEQGYDLVSSDFAWIDAEDRVINPMVFSGHDIAGELRRGHNILCHPSIALAASFWRGCSRFSWLADPKREDFGLWLRELDRCRYVIAPQILCYHRHHAASVSERPETTPVVEVPIPVEPKPDVPASIGLLIVATRRYRQYVGELMAQIPERFFPDDKVTVHLFSEGSFPRTVWHRTEALRFPEATILRFQLFDEAADDLKDHDYLFYLDVDARLERVIGREILPERPGLVALHHTGFGAGSGAWEQRVGQSRAACRPGPGQVYFMGGFNGGTTAEYLAMCAELRADVEEDLRYGRMPAWHDESFLNRYLIDHPPRVVLPQGFSGREGYVEWGERSLTWLAKDHDAMRT